MSVKHKVLKDFQLLTNDKKIIVLKAKTVLEDYKYITKSDNVLVEREIIDNNPDFFSPIDWKEELNTYLRQNKIPQPAVITKKLVPFIEGMFVINNITSNPTSIPTTNLQNNLELENSIKKNLLLEEHLKSEIEKINKKDIEISSLEKEINTKSTEINKLSEDLRLREENLSQLEQSLKMREIQLVEKESKLDHYIEVDVVKKEIDSLLEEMSKQGFYTVDGLISSLRQQLSQMYIK
jgi:hypothetical protein